MAIQLYIALEIVPRVNIAEAQTQHKYILRETKMPPQQIKDNAPDGATHYCKITDNMFYLKWINRDLYRTVSNDGSKFFVDTKQYEIKPL